jgi:hypothetical protein
MEDAIAYVGSSGDLLCKSCLVWMCAAGWILSSSQTGAACCVPIWVGDLGMRRRRKKKSWEKKRRFVYYQHKRWVGICAPLSIKLHRPCLVVEESAMATYVWTLHFKF